MVPKVAGKGRSFKGAGLYYLHDKQARTTNRVAYTHTLNLPTDDPDKAIGWMAHTAMRQAEIKRAAGGVAKGRKLRDPVYAYSLSWAPDEQPTRDQMIEAALETLTRLGLDGHEALLVSHNDEPHPHIHVIVNRVNPETGIAAPLSNDHLKLSEWAEGYEKQHGKIRCAQRVENNARRKREFVKDRASQKAAEFHRWRKERREADFQRRQQESRTLNDTQRRARDDLTATRDRLIESRRRQLKERYKPTWAALFRAQRAETRTFEDAQKTVFGRLRYWLKNREIDRFGGSQLDRQGMLSRAFQIVVNSDHMRRALVAKQEADRKALAAHVGDETRRAVGTIYRAHDRAQASAKQRQAAERADQQQRHRSESQEAARRAAAGGDRAAFDFERAQKGGPDEDSLSGDFGAAVRDEESPARAGAETDSVNPQEQGEAARIIRAARERGLDESHQDDSAGDRGSDQSGGRGGERGGRRAFSAFRDARRRKGRGEAHTQGKDAPGAPDAPQTTPEAPEGGKAFTAFRRAKEAREATREAGGDSEKEGGTDEGGTAFRAFRNARDGRARGGRDRERDGIERERTPPSTTPPPGKKG